MSNLTKPKFAPAYLAKLAEINFADEYYGLCIGYGFCERTGEKFSGTDIVKALKTIGDAHQFPGPGRVFEARLTGQPPELRLTFQVYSGGHTLEPTLSIDDGDFKLGGQFCSLAHWINEALGRERHNPPFPRPSFFTLLGLIDCVQKHQALAMRVFQAGRELREANPAIPLVTQVDLVEEHNIALAIIPPVEIARVVDRRKHKSELKQIEAEMAESYSAKNGVEAALKVFGCTSAWLVFLILRAQRDRLSYDELSASSSRLLEPLDRYLHIRLLIQLLAAEANCGVSVSTTVQGVLHSVSQIGPGEKSYGNVGMRQDLLHELGEMLLKHNQPEMMPAILVLMGRSSRRVDLQRKLNEHSSAETAL